MPTQLSIPLQPVVGALLNDPASTALSSTLTEIEYPSSDGTYSVIFTVLNQAIIDGVPTSQGIAFTASAGEFTITLPYFTNTAEWDPGKDSKSHTKTTLVSAYFLNQILG